MKHILIILILFYIILPGKFCESSPFSDLNTREPNINIHYQVFINSAYMPVIVDIDSTKSDTTSYQTDSTKFINYGVNLLWQQDLGTPLAALPLVWENKLYIATKDGYVNCYDINGKRLWQTYVSGTIVSQPAAADNYLAVGTLEGDITSLNTKTGKIVQTIGIGEPIITPLLAFDYQGVRDIIIDNDNLSSSIAIGTESGKLYCYDLSSFGFLWVSDVSKAEIHKKPAYIDNKMIFSNSDGNTYCLDSRSGIMIWKWSNAKKLSPLNLNNIPVNDDENVYISPYEKSLFAIDILLGKTNWSKETYMGFLSYNLSADSTNLLISSSSNKFYFVSAKEGKIIKELNPICKIDSVTCRPIEVNGNVISSSSENKIFLIDKEYNQKPLLFTGASGILSLQKMNDKIILAVTSDGKIFAFEIQ